MLPNYTHELQHAYPVTGVDEAGRGPLAGPVVAAAVILNPQAIPPGLNDSKKLNPTQREALFTVITASAQYGIGHASVEEIDTINILNATLLAMQRAIVALPIVPQHILVDGNRLPPSLPCNATAIVKGDSKSLSIAAASIIAKVTRDRIMQQLCAEFPHYGFSRHAGYGTKAHLAALQQRGPCPQHRQSFAPVRAALEKPFHAA